MRICPQCGARFGEPIQYCPEDGSQTYEAQDERAEPLDPLLGRVIDGRYRIEQQIGEGGMGVVYLATHTVLQKKLALKVLRGDSARDAEVVQRFMQEAQAATSIGHQNIIDISDFGRLPDGAVYFVMEFLDGTSLADLINRGGSLPLKDALHLVRQIVSALDAAHARGIVHRDLKPDNIVIVKQGADPLFVKVLDFGVAKVGGAASKLTKTGMVFGTPHYMSPEQAAGQSVDQRTDIYALGVIMYEMFTGKVPFDADTFMGILSKHMFEVPARPTDLRGATLGPVEAIILKALEKSPDDRYASMSDLLADLDTVAAGGTIAVGARPGVAPPTNLVDPLGPSHVADTPPVKTGGGAAIALVALAVVALVLVGGGVAAAVFLMTDQEEGQALAQAPQVAEEPEEPPSRARPSTPPEEAPAPAREEASEASVTAAAPPLEPSAEAAAIQTIEISTEPPGAEVVLDGVMVGNAPVAVPKPASGIQEVVLRLREYEETTIQISARTGASLHVTLEREHSSRSSSARSRMRSGMSSSVASPAGTPVAHPAPPPRLPSVGANSEVVDPWAQ